jgi:hypothetical protein
MFTEMVHSNAFPLGGDCGVIFRIDEDVKIFGEGKEIEKERAPDVGSCMCSSPNDPAEGRIGKSIPAQFLKWKSTSHIGVVPDKPTFKDLGGTPILVVALPRRRVIKMREKVYASLIQGQCMTVAN